MGPRQAAGCVVAILALLAFQAAWGGEAAPPAPGAREQAVWFGDLEEDARLPEELGLRLVEHAARLLKEGRAAEDALPAAVRADQAPRIVFLSVSDGARPAAVELAAARGVLPAVRSAVKRLRRWVGRDYPVRWLKLDLPWRAAPLTTVELEGPLRLELGLDGIAFDPRSGVAFLPGQVLAQELVGAEGRIDKRRVARELLGRGRATEEFLRVCRARQSLVYLFRAQGFFSEGDETYALFRDRRAAPPLTPEGLLEAARMAGQYLARSVTREGWFIYAYEPRRNGILPSYNIVRHAGTVYAMFELYEVTRDESLLAAARRALEHLLAQAKPVETGGHRCLGIEEEGVVKLGGNALACLALVKHMDATGERKHLDALHKLALLMLATQAEDGRFTVHMMRLADGHVSDLQSSYYPGEACFALVRVYGVDKDERWLEAAEKGAHYLITVRDRGRSLQELEHDHWLLYALNELVRHRRKPLYLEHAFRLAEAIVAAQNREPEVPDWGGSYYKPPRSTPTATRSEALYAAYFLARDFGPRERAERFLDALRLGVAFQLRTQLRAPSVLYLPHPTRALGGFHRSLTDLEVRIDYSQHNLSSLLGLRRILLSAGRGAGEDRDAP